MNKNNKIGYLWEQHMDFIHVIIFFSIFLLFGRKNLFFCDRNRPFSSYLWILYYENSRPLRMYEWLKMPTVFQQFKALVKNFSRTAFSYVFHFMFGAALHKFDGNYCSKYLYDRNPSCDNFYWNMCLKFPFGFGIIMQ